METNWVRTMMLVVLMVRKLYGRWLAYWIERAYSHPDYNANMPYLCHIILYKFKSPLRFQVMAHIQDMLSWHQTLRHHLWVATNFNFPPNWEDREVFHRRFWILKCKALRAGDLDWGRKPDLIVLGLRKPDEV